MAGSLGLDDVSLWLLTLHLDSNGRLAKRISSEPFFDPDVDPVNENAAALGRT